MPLVAASDFEGLPQEPEARWLQLRDLVEKRLDNGFDMNNGGHETYNLLEYVQVLSAAAEELGIGALEKIYPGNVHEDFDAFRESVTGLATRLSLRLKMQNSTYSVALSRPTRKEIFLNIEDLRSIIRRSDISEKKREEASDIVDQIQILILAPRTDIARVGILLVALGAFAVGTTSFLADLPPALGTISALIGADKREEESEQTLIEDAREKLQIQDLREKPNEEAKSETGYEPNDEIPF